jgi:hypothetical protein
LTNRVNRTWFVGGNSNNFSCRTIPMENLLHMILRVEQMVFVANKDHVCLPGKRSIIWETMGFPSISINGFGTAYPARRKRSPNPDIGITICKKASP